MMPSVEVAPMVFIVDDDPIMRLVAKAALEKGGFRVTQARNGADALERLLGGETCQLLMTDLQMPELDGAALIEGLRADPRFAALPIIILTGGDPSGEPVDCVAMGADGWTAKPVDPQHLLSLIRAALTPRDAIR